MSQTIRWYIVLTKAAAEWQTHKELLDKGINCYYPSFIASVRRNRWHQGAIKPQFPGYLFVGLEPGESIERVRQCHGVRDFIRDRGGLVAISDEQMDRCKAVCAQETEKHVPRRAVRDPIKVGDWVAVPSGAFAGISVEVKAVDKSGLVSAYIGNLTVAFHISAVQKSARQSAKPAEIQLLKAS